MTVSFLKIHHKDTKTQRSHKAGIVRTIELLCAVFVSLCLCGESDFPAHRTCLEVMVRRRGRESSRPAKILQVSSADYTGKDAGGFIRSNIEAGTTIISDGFKSYTNLAGYKHYPIVQGAGANAGVNMPIVQ